jgi:hypothetical protein
MDQDRRTALRRLATTLIGGFLVQGRPVAAWAQEVTGGQELQEILQGTWNLQSYNYTSNNRTYSSPDEMEATATFNEATYSVEFAVHIGAVGVRRTRRASESGTFSIDGNRILLNAEEASAEGELGEEVLSEIRFDGNVMSLLSNNGNNREVWGKAAPQTHPYSR